MNDNPSSAQHDASPREGLQDARGMASAEASPPAGAATTTSAANAAALEFNEEWYLSRYPGVARAIRDGLFKTGLQHYLAHGQKEGRIPVPPPGAIRPGPSATPEQVVDLAKGADLAPRASQTQHLAVRLPEDLRNRHATFVQRRAGMTTDTVFLTSSALLKAADGDFAAAETAALDAFRIIAANPESDPTNFTAVLTALFVVQRFDLVAHMLRARSTPAPILEIAVEENGPGVNRVRWEIDASRRHRFVFDATLLQPAHDFRVLEQINRLAPLFFNYAKSPDAETGSVILNQADLGISPGLSYSDSRPGYFLIPDHVFVSSRGYQSARDHFAANPIPWAERLPVAFWRGSSTGICAQRNAWRTLERVKLCELARANQKSGLFDVGLSHIVGFTDPNTISQIETSGLVLGRVPWQTWNTYKYLIDIDGNSSPWSNLFQRLLTGSPVLKVESYRGLRQWYYDDLVAWDNYVPIASDASDLVDKVKWLTSHDSIAERIGQRGRDLALRLTYESELARSVPVITSAFREARGETSPQFGLRPSPPQGTTAAATLSAGFAAGNVNAAPGPMMLTTAQVDTGRPAQSPPQAVPAPSGGPTTPTPSHTAVMQALYGRNVWEGYVPTRPSQGPVHGWNGRWPSFATLLRQAPSHVFIDVGVWKGQSSIFVAQLIRQEKLDGCVISVDTFLGSPENWSAEKELFQRYVGHPDLFQTFIENVYYNGVADLIVPMPQASLLAAFILRTRGVMAGMIHIDASHAYEDVIRDCDAFWPLVRRGGYMVGDDYSKAHPGVVRAAHEFSDKLGLKLSTEGPKWWVHKPR